MASGKHPGTPGGRQGHRRGGGGEGRGQRDFATRGREATGRPSRCASRRKVASAHRREAEGSTGEDDKGLLMNHVTECHRPYVPQARMGLLAEGQALESVMEEVRLPLSSA